MYSVGVSGAIGSVYTEAEMLQGKAPGDGTLGYGNVTTGTGVFLMCKIATGNIIKGNLVTLDASYNATLAAVAAGPTVRQQVGVAVCTVTASTSSHIWVQIWGRGQVLASVSCDPFVQLGVGAVAGQVDDGVTSLSATIDGLWTTGSTGAATGLVACILNYPAYTKLA